MKIFLYNGTQIKVIKKLSLEGWVQIEMLEGVEKGVRRPAKLLELVEVV